MIDLIDSKNTGLLKDAYFGLGINYYHIGELDSSIKYYKFAEELNNYEYNTLFESSLYNEIGIIYTNKGLNHNSIYYLNKALSINNELNNKEGIIINQMNLGKAYYKINSLDSSEKFFELAFKNIEFSNTYDRNIILNNLCIIYNEKGELNKAIKTMRQIVSSMGEISPIDSLYYKTNLDIMLIKKGLSPLYYQDISNYLDFTKQNEIKYADALFKKSIYLIYFDNDREAYRYLTKANSIYISKHNLSEAINISTFFSSVLNNNHSLNDSLNSNISSLRIKELALLSNLLIKEMHFKTQIEKSITSLKEELQFAWDSTKLLIILLLVLVILIPLLIKHILTLKLLSKIRSQLLDFNHEVSLLHNNKIKNNLGKFISLMVLSNKFDSNEIFARTIDEVVEGSNDLSDFLNNINRSLNVNNPTTANELPVEGQQS